MVTTPPSLMMVGVTDRPLGSSSGAIFSTWIVNVVTAYSGAPKSNSDSVARTVALKSSPPTGASTSAFQANTPVTGSTVAPGGPESRLYTSAPVLSGSLATACTVSVSPSFTDCGGIGSTTGGTSPDGADTDTFGLNSEIEPIWTAVSIVPRVTPGGVGIT